MSIYEIFLIGLGLSMDATAVSMTNGMVYQCPDRIKTWAMPVFFGVFQAGMPLLGYMAGTLFASLIDQYAGIVTLIILGFIGGKMIWDAFHSEEESRSGGVTLGWGTLLMQSVATSIDAFAVGVSFCAMQVAPLGAVGIIGITTFFCSMAAIAIGKKCGDALGTRAQIFGGAILILIGIKSMFF